MLNINIQTFIILGGKVKAFHGWKYTGQQYCFDRLGGNKSENGTGRNGKEIGIIVAWLGRDRTVGVNFVDGTGRYSTMTFSFHDRTGR